MNIIINQMDRVAADGFVVTVHWTVSKTDGNYSASQYGTQSFTFDPAEPGFVPYEQLTKEIVTGWLTEKWGADGVAAKEAALDAQLAELAAPAITTGLPWAA
jgi:hypothetical protein